MLVLSSDVGDKIYAGPVTITIIRASYGKVRLGFEAPPEVDITRADAVIKGPRANHPGIPESCPSVTAATSAALVRAYPPEYTEHELA